MRTIILIVTSFVSLGLSGCVVVPANGYGQQLVYQQPPPCVQGTVDTGRRNQTGGRVCGIPQAYPSQPQGLPQGCVRTIYGTHCNQADGYVLQAPQVPGRAAQPNVGQPTCPYSGTLRIVNGQLLCVR